MIGAGDNDPAPGGGVVTPFELAGGQSPGQRRAHGDAGHEKDYRMRQFHARAYLIRA
jgi:hypothetical protein